MITARLIFFSVKRSMSNLSCEFNKEVEKKIIVQSPTSPNILRVGPIHIEVKSTRVASPIEEDVNKELPVDLFGISLAEAACAYDLKWRYHLMRVRWGREHMLDDTKQPHLTHIPDLAGTLFRQPSYLRLLVGMNN